MPDMIHIPEGLNPLAEKADQDFGALVKTGDWLPRLQLMIAASDKCKGGEFPINHYALVNGQDFTDLGETVDVLIVSWRAKAMDISGDEIINVHDIDSEEFKRIEEASAEKDSGCMFGPEFLVWLPTIKAFATFFMGSKSARREAPGLKSRMQNSATLSSKKIETKRFTWYAPLCTDCSTPFDLPDQESLVKEVTKFGNPPAPDTELAPIDQSSRAV